MFSTLTKRKIKFIRSLQVKKYRREHGCFIAEGGKIVAEILSSGLLPAELVVTERFLKENNYKIDAGFYDVHITDEKTLEVLGTLKSNRDALAVLRVFPEEPLYAERKGEFVLALDGINDPGNLGTLIRTADWFGIDKIVCSEHCADRYNPKVIAASMGSFLHVKMFYTSLDAYLAKANRPVYAAVLNGKPIWETKFADSGILLMGSESHGVSEVLMPYVTEAVSIPGYGRAESLNVGVAAGILCEAAVHGRHSTPF